MLSLRAVVITLLSLVTAGQAQADVPPPPNPPPLALSLVFTKGEHSKDSHARRFAVTVQGAACDFTGPEPPCERGRCQEVNRSFKLDAAELASLHQAIARGKLDRVTFAEKQPTDQTGSYVQVALAVGPAKKAASTVVHGMTKIWGGPGEKGNLGDSALERLAAVERVLDVLEEAAKKRR